MIFILLGFILQTTYPSIAQSPKGKQTGVSFDQALPEDISNENFPNRIESFDFPKANLLDLVQAISKLTGMNFILDTSLNSKQISIIASSPITVAEAYKAFLSALSANNYSVVKSGAFWKIQAIDKIHKDNIEVYSGDYFPSTDQLITRIIKLKYISAKDFEASIKWLLSQDNKSSSHEPSNSLIISDYGSVIERIMKIVYEIDVPGLEEEVYTIEVEHASAEDLAVILRELLSIGRSSNNTRKSRLSRTSRSKSIVLSPSFKSQSGESRSKISHIIPDERTNSLIVRADTKGIERVRSLVKKLDKEANLSRTGGVWVYNVLYGTAEEVYNTLMGIKPAQEKGSHSRSRYFVTNSNKGSTQKRSSESPLFKGVNIMADSNTNSLIVSARSKYEYGRVLNVLKKIDVPRDQVFIQAIILEMIVGRGNVSDFNLAGALSLLFRDLKSSKEDKSVFRELGESALAGFFSSSFGLGSIQQAQFGPGLILGLPFLKLFESLGVDAFGENSNSNLPADWDDLKSNERETYLNAQARASVNNYASNPLRQSLATSFLPIVKLLRKSDNVNILSTPQITTLDNVPAFIEVGENAPVGLSNTATVTGVSQNTERADVTLKLEIVPFINPESGTVQMDIKQKFDDFSQRSSLAADLNRQAVSIVKRNIETKMVLHDGETAVLGGLLSDKKVTNANKVPLLGDLPFVGWLFKGSDVQTEKRNLLVFITPTIISGNQQKEKSQKILDNSLEDRIEFIEKNMKGRDPHENILEDLVPRSKVVKNKKKTSFWKRLGFKKHDKKNDKKDKSPNEKIRVDEFQIEQNNLQEGKEQAPEDRDNNLLEENEPPPDNFFIEKTDSEDSLNIPPATSGYSSDSDSESDSESSDSYEEDEDLTDDESDFNGDLLDKSKQETDRKDSIIEDDSNKNFFIEDSFIPLEENKKSE